MALSLSQLDDTDAATNKKLHAAAHAKGAAAVAALSASKRALLVQKADAAAAAEHEAQLAKAVEEYMTSLKGDGLSREDQIAALNKRLYATETTEAAEAPAKRPKTRAK